MLDRPANAAPNLGVAPPRPLITVQTIMDLAGIGEDQAAALADSGKVLAFDIRMPRARRRVLRFYYKSFSLWLAKAPLRNYNTDAVIREIIGAERPTIAAANFARAIRACPTHVANLIRSRAVRAITRPRRGPCGSPNLCWKSAAAFLRSARIQ